MPQRNPTVDWPEYISNIASRVFVSISWASCLQLMCWCCVQISEHFVWTADFWRSSDNGCTSRLWHVIWFINELSWKWPSTKSSTSKFLWQIGGTTYFSEKRPGTTLLVLVGDCCIVPPATIPTVSMHKRKRVNTNRVYFHLVTFSFNYHVFFLFCMDFGYFINAIFWWSVAFSILLWHSEIVIGQQEGHMVCKNWVWIC